MYHRLFFSHPNSHGMSYTQHLLFAMSICATLMLCVVACVLHAAVPMLFPDTVSGTIKRLNEQFAQRKAALEGR